MIFQCNNLLRSEQTNLFFMYFLNNIVPKFLLFPKRALKYRDYYAMELIQCIVKIITPLAAANFLNFYITTMLVIKPDY